MFANVKKKIQQAKQNSVFILCFSDTYPEHHASDSMEGLLTLTVQHGKHSASCVFFFPLFLPTFVASL